jgi:RHS repeat-associated protein
MHRAREIGSGSSARKSSPESGLHYYRARYYDPSSGRFLAGDPIGFSGGLNFYSYTRNRPTGLTDPSGKCTNGIDTVVCLLVGIGVAVTVTAVLDYNTSLQNLDNLAYNNNAAMQNAMKICWRSPFSAEACQAAMDLGAETYCRLVMGIRKSTFAGLGLPGTLTGGDLPSSRWDLVGGALQDRIMKDAERRIQQAEKKADKKGCGCDK